MVPPFTPPAKISAYLRINVCIEREKVYVLPVYSTGRRPSPYPASRSAARAGYATNAARTPTAHT